MDWVMNGQAFQRLRTDLLQDARGEILEIGFGTGLNLLHYPTSVSRLSVVDPVDLLPHRVSERIAAVSFPVQPTQATAEALPYPDRQFDQVISTWTLCTIPDPIQALREIARVLKPEGTLLFLEHGRSDDRTIAAWQDRLNPIQNVIGCGCHLNRPIDRLIAQAGLEIAHLDRFLLPDVPRIAGDMYRGSATLFPSC
jgi:ubiquinone/menaquinone biosynthesis C-methylase UbiE